MENPSISSVLSDPRADAGPARAITPGEAMVSELMALEPDSWPEILREQTALAGAVDGALRAARDVRERLVHVLRLPLPEPTSVPPAPGPEVDTAVGQRLRSAYYEAVEAEHILRDVLHRLAI